MAAEDETREAADGTDVQMEAVDLGTVRFEAHPEVKLPSIMEIKNVGENIDSAEGTLTLPEDQVLVEAPSEVKLPPEHNLNGKASSLNGHMDKEEKISNEQPHENNQEEAELDGTVHQSNGISKEEVIDSLSHGESTTEDNSLLKHEEDEEPSGDDQQDLGVTVDVDSVLEDTLKTDSAIEQTDDCQQDQNQEPEKANQDTEPASTVSNVEVVSEAPTVVQTPLEPNLDDSGTVPGTINEKMETEEPDKADGVVHPDHKEGFPEETSTAESTEEAVKVEDQRSQQAYMMDADVVQEEMLKREETHGQEDVPNSEAHEPTTNAQETLNKESAEEIDDPMNENNEEAVSQSNMEAPKETTPELETATRAPPVNVQVQNHEPSGEREHAEAVDTEAEKQQSSVAFEDAILEDQQKLSVTIDNDPVQGDTLKAIEQKDDSQRDQDRESEETTEDTQPTSMPNIPDVEVVAEAPSGAQTPVELNLENHVIQDTTDGNTETDEPAKADGVTHPGHKESFPEDASVAGSADEVVKVVDQQSQQADAIDEDVVQEDVPQSEHADEPATNAPEVLNQESTEETDGPVNEKMEESAHQSNMAAPEETTPEDDTIMVELPVNIQVPNQESVEEIEDAGSVDTQAAMQQSTVAFEEAIPEDQRNLGNTMAGGTCQENTLEAIEQTEDVLRDHDLGQEKATENTPPATMTSIPDVEVVAEAPSGVQTPVAINLDRSDALPDTADGNTETDKSAKAEGATATSEPQVTETVEEPKDIEATEAQEIAEYGHVTPSNELPAEDDSTADEPHNDDIQQTLGQDMVEVKETVFTSEDNVDDNVTAEEPPCDSQEAENAESTEETKGNTAENIAEVSDVVIVDAIKDQNVLETGDIAETHTRELEPEETKNTEPVESEEASDQRNAVLFHHLAQEDTPESETQQTKSATETTESEAAPQESNDCVSEEPSPEDHKIESETECDTQEVSITESLEVIDGDKDIITGGISGQSNMVSAGELPQEKDVPESEPTADIRPVQESKPEEIKNTELVEVKETSHEMNTTVFQSPTEEDNPTTIDLPESARELSNTEATEVGTPHQSDAAQSEEQAPEGIASEPQVPESESVEEMNDIEATELSNIPQGNLICTSGEFVPEEIATEDKKSSKPDGEDQESTNFTETEADKPHGIASSSTLSTSEQSTSEYNETAAEPSSDTQAGNSDPAEVTECAENVKSNSALAEAAASEEHVETDATADTSSVQDPELEETKDSEPTETEDVMTSSDLPAENMGMETMGTEAVPRENHVETINELTEDDSTAEETHNDDTQQTLGQDPDEVKETVFTSEDDTVVDITAEEPTCDSQEVDNSESIEETKGNTAENIAEVSNVVFVGEAVEEQNELQAGNIAETHMQELQPEATKTTEPVESEEASDQRNAVLVNDLAQEDTPKGEMQQMESATETTETEGAPLESNDCVSEEPSPDHKIESETDRDVQEGNVTESLEVIDGDKDIITGEISGQSNMVSAGELAQEKDIRKSEPTADIQPVQESEPEEIKNVKLVEAKETSHEKNTIVFQTPAEEDNPTTTDLHESARELSNTESTEMGTPHQSDAAQSEEQEPEGIASEPQVPKSESVEEMNGTEAEPSTEDKTSTEPDGHHQQLQVQESTDFMETEADKPQGIASSSTLSTSEQSTSEDNENAMEPSSGTQAENSDPAEVTEGAENVKSNTEAAVSEEHVESDATADTSSVQEPELEETKDAKPVGKEDIMASSDLPAENMDMETEAVPRESHVETIKELTVDDCTAEETHNDDIQQNLGQDPDGVKKAVFTSEKDTVDGDTVQENTLEVIAKTEDNPRDHDLGQEKTTENTPPATATMESIPDVEVVAPAVVINLDNSDAIPDTVDGNTETDESAKAEDATATSEPQVTETEDEPKDIEFTEAQEITEHNHVTPSKELSAEYDSTADEPYNDDIQQILGQDLVEVKEIAFTSEDNVEGIVTAEEPTCDVQEIDSAESTEGTKGNTAENIAEVSDIVIDDEGVEEQNVLKNGDIAETHMRELEAEETKNTDPVESEEASDQRNDNLFKDLAKEDSEMQNTDSVTESTETEAAPHASNDCVSEEPSPEDHKIESETDCNIQEANMTESFEVIDGDKHIITGGITGQSNMVPVGESGQEKDVPESEPTADTQPVQEPESEEIKNAKLMEAKETSHDMNTTVFQTPTDEEDNPTTIDLHESARELSNSEETEVKTPQQSDAAQSEEQASEGIASGPQVPQTESVEEMNDTEAIEPTNISQGNLISTSRESAPEEIATEDKTSTGLDVDHQQLQDQESLVEPKDIENSTKNRTEDTAEDEQTEAAITEILEHEEEDADAKNDNKDEESAEKNDIAATDSTNEQDETTDEITNEELKPGSASSDQEASDPAPSNDDIIESDPAAVTQNVESGEHSDDKECTDKVNDDVHTIQASEEEITGEINKSREIQNEDNAINHDEVQTKPEDEEASQLHSDEPCNMDAKIDNATTLGGEIIDGNASIKPREKEDTGENKGLHSTSEQNNVEQDSSSHQKVEDEKLSIAEPNDLDIEAASDMQEKADESASDINLTSQCQEEITADDVQQLEIEENSSDQIDETVSHEKTETSTTEAVTVNDSITNKASEADGGSSDRSLKTCSDTGRDLDVSSVITASKEESVNENMEDHKLALPAQDENTPEQELYLEKTEREMPSSQKILPTEPEENQIPNESNEEELQDENPVPDEKKEEDMKDEESGDAQKDVEQDLPVSHFLMNLILGKKNGDADENSESEAERNQGETTEDNSCVPISKQEESVESLSTENKVDDDLTFEQEKHDVKCSEETQEMVKEQSDDHKLDKETSIYTDEESNKSTRDLEMLGYQCNPEDKISGEVSSEEAASVSTKMETRDIEISNLELDDKAVDTVCQEKTEASTKIENGSLKSNINDLTNTEASEEDTVGEGETGILPESLSEDRSADAVSDKPPLLTESVMVDEKDLSCDVEAVQDLVCAKEDVTTEPSIKATITPDIQLECEVEKKEQEQHASTATIEVSGEDAEISNDIVQKSTSSEVTSDEQAPQITEPVSDTQKLFAHEKEISEDSPCMDKKESSNFSIKEVENFQTAVEIQADGPNTQVNQDKKDEVADNKSITEPEKLGKSDFQEHQETATEQKSPKATDEREWQLLVKKGTMIKEQVVPRTVESDEQTVSIKSNEEHELFDSKVQERDLNVVSPREVSAAEENFVDVTKPEFSTDEEQSPKAYAEEKTYDEKIKDFTDGAATKTEVHGATPKAHKKHSLLSGVGSKVKQQLAKVKKAIVRKPGNTKPDSTMS